MDGHLEEGIMKKESLSSLIVTDGLPEELDLLQLQQQEGQKTGRERSSARAQQIHSGQWC